MKLSFSILLLVAAMQAQAAVTHNGVSKSKCVSGSYGNGNGDGYKGFCCSDSDDCFNSCIRGVCNGPTQPTTSGKCISGSKGLGEGDGYNGYCCDDSDDCHETCVKGVCNGPTNTKTTTAAAEPTSTCAAGSKGLGNGDGYKGDCCKNSDDCVNSCVRGVCNGPFNPNPNPGKCISGYKGNDNGDGPHNACCSSSDDCQDACVRGRCTKP
ncbi:hypothetical protein G6F56_009272 [Rhizopus delemar]|nr:hypothetical protein G6F56_009272 [Rhizopus delemar]